MKALILNNKVVDTNETEFPVHKSLTWVNCGNEVKIGFSYDGNTFTSNESTAEELQTLADAKTAQANNKTSGKAKLKSGEALTDAEIDALFG